MEGDQDSLVQLVDGFRRRLFVLIFELDYKSSAGPRKLYVFP